MNENYFVHLMLSIEIYLLGYLLEAGANREFEYSILSNFNVSFYL